MSQQQEKRSHKVIQYYLDPQMKNPAPTKIIQEYNNKGELVDVDTGELELNFGTCLQGEAKRIKLYAANTIEYNIQLEPIIENNEPDLKITKYPPILKAGEVGEVIITFQPDIDRIKPLESGFDFRKIILTRT